MKNLKRALSVVLSAAMMIGLLAVGASAASFQDFTDKDEITHTEAVSTLNTLNVINGKDTGSFDPTGIVTRAEMAKMICVILNGGKDPQLGTANTNTYTDTVGHWAAAYIEYCTNLGIVAGDGTGNFNPNATVTGTQAAKMLLVAMGYDTKYENFVGNTWDISVNVLANQKGLYDELSINPSTGLSRDDAAQMVYNAINAKMVYYDNALVTNSNGSLTSVATVHDETYTMLNNKFKAVKVEGVVVGNEFATLPDTTGAYTSAKDAGKTTIRITNADEIKAAGWSFGDVEDAGKTALSDETFKVSTGADELGRAVILYVKPSTASPTNADKATAVGGAILDDSNNDVYVTTNDDSWADALDASDMDYVAGTVKAYNVAATDGTNGVERTFIDNNGDGDVDYVLYNTYYFGKVTKYSTKDDGSINVKVATDASSTATLSEDKSSNVIGFADVAKDDYVIAGMFGGKLHVSQAQTVEGSLTAYNTNKSLTVDGTKYSTGVSGAAIDTDTFQNPNSYGAAATLDKDATFYMDNNKCIVAVGSATGASDAYAFIWASDKNALTGDYTVKATLSTGVTGTYTVNDKAGTVGASVASTSDLDKLFFNYTLNSDNEITLTNVANSTTGTDVFSFDKGKATITGNKTLYGDSDTMFFYVTYKADGTTVKDVDVYTGIANAPSVSTSPSSIKNVMVASGATSTTANAVVTYGASTSANGDYLYLYGYKGTNSDGAFYRAVLNGALYDGSDNSHPYIYTDDNTQYANGVYEYTVTSAGLYQIKSAPANEVTGFVAAKSGSSVIINNTEYTMNSDATVATIDGGDTTVGDSLYKNDYVTLVYDQSGSDMNVSGAFVLEAQDDSNANILAVDGIVDADSTYDYVTNTASQTGATVVSDVTASYDATVKVVASKPATLAAATSAAAVAGTLSGATEYYIVVISNDGTVYNVYTLYTHAD